MSKQTRSRTPLVILAIILIAVGAVSLCCSCGTFSWALNINPEDADAWGESFGESMEAWGKDFGHRMDEWGRDFGHSMEGFGRSFGGVGQGLGIVLGTLCGLCPLGLILVGAALVYTSMRRKTPSADEAQT